MASVIDLCNRALSKVGASRALSLDDETVGAKACKHAYPFVRDSVLEEHPWGFTVKRISLAPMSESPAYEYDYQYMLPGDCLKVLSVDTDQPWLIENSAVVTNEGPALNIRYQSRVEDVTKFGPTVFELIASKLAYEICEELTQSNTKKQQLFSDYRLMMRQAKKSDSRQRSNVKLENSKYFEARY